MVTSLVSLSSEVLLRILGNLEDARDLVRFRQVNRRLYQVGGDTLLWKDLFVFTYFRPSSTSTYSEQIPYAKRRRLSYNTDDADHDSPKIASTSARVIKGLPMLRDFASSISESGGRDDRRVDWYTLFKVSRNWQTGNFSSRQLQTLQSSSHDTDSASAGPSKISLSGEQNRAIPQTLVDSTSSHIFTSLYSQSDNADVAPVLLVFPSSCRDGISGGERSQEALARFQSAASLSDKLDSVRISSLTVDKGQMQGTSVRLFIGYSSGDSSLVYFNTATNIFHDELHLRNEGDSIVSAALHCYMLVTCTVDFKIRLYNTSRKQVRLIEERRSYCCHWPASLRLEPLNKKDNNPVYRLSIAYSSPVYPIGWTVGLQEIIVGTQSSTLSRSASARRSHVVTCLDSPSKEDKGKRLVGRTFDIQERRSQVGRLTSLSYEDPFIVVGTKDNNVICFKVAGSTKEDERLKNPAVALELNHVCTFQGHTGTVHSVSLNEGRCVTGGSDGSVRVWRLGDEEAAVAKAAGLLTTIDASLRRGLGKVVTIGATITSSKRKRETKEVVATTPLSLSDILREAKRASGSSTRTSSSSAVVRLVTSAFDHIISVSAVKTATVSTPGTSSTCRAESIIDREDEQVQIWNFAQ